MAYSLSRVYQDVHEDAFNRGRHLHADLVGHHLGERFVLFYAVADLLEPPLDDGLGDRFPNVWVV